MYRTVIIGAGPGGTGPLIWAAQNGLLEDWLDEGVALLDSGSAIGGTIGRYIVNSDTAASVYLEFLDAAPAKNLFAPLLNDPATAELRRYGTDYPPLSLVDRYMRRFGSVLQGIVAEHRNSIFRPLTTVRALYLGQSGRTIVEIATANGAIDHISTETVVMALGGCQSRDSIFRAQLRPGIRLDAYDPAKIMASDRFLTVQGLQEAEALLTKSRGTGRLVILGGSHSAFSCAWALTDAMRGMDFAPGQISMLLRQQPKIFYPTAEAAESDSYDFTEDNICPRTKRVHRLAGLRSDGREMWRRLTGRSGAPEKRVQMLPLDDTMDAAGLHRLLSEADLIVPAFGYCSRTVPVYDFRGHRVKLAADRGGVAVGRDARFLTAEGESLPNLFGIGLGSGYKPWGRMGGEPSFKGQANSLWLYQHGIGEVVYRGLRQGLETARSRGVRTESRAMPSRFLDLLPVELPAEPNLRAV